MRVHFPTPLVPFFFHRLVLKTVNRKVIWNMGFLHLKHLAMLVGMVDVIFSDVA